MSSPELPAAIPPTNPSLSIADFHRLADVPLEIEWFANIDNPQTRRAYKNALEDFMKFIGIERPAVMKADPLTQVEAPGVRRDERP